MSDSKKRSILQIKRNVIKTIEKKFSKSFKDSGFKLIIKHKADSQMLHYYLTSPKTVALFWISHATSEKKLLGVGKLPEVILDENNIVNVANIFKTIHPNMRFLSIIGCEAEHIIKRYINDGQYAKNPNLRIHSFKNIVALGKGVKQAIKISSKYLSQNLRRQRTGRADLGRRRPKEIKIFAKNNLLVVPMTKMPKEQGIEIGITPTSQLKQPVQLIIDHRLIGLLLPGDLVQKFVVPKELIKRKIRLLVSTGKTLTTISTEVKIGMLNITSTDDIFEVDYYKNLNGDLEGVDSNIYYLSQEL